MDTSIKSDNGGDEVKEEGKVILKGVPASPGIARGKVKILFSPHEVNKMNNGDILVAPFTTPLYTPALMRASAIVTDFGGFLCHAAIIARELGVPAVVGTDGATKKLKDNMEVIVDGKEGIICE